MVIGSREAASACLTDVAADFRSLTQDLDPLVPADCDRRAGEKGLSTEHAGDGVSGVGSLENGTGGLGLAFGPRQAERTDKNHDFDHGAALRSKRGVPLSAAAVKEP